MCRRDPFHRLLIAQARVGGLPILSADGRRPAYDVPIHWADWTRAYGQCRDSRRSRPMVPSVPV